MFCKIEIYVQKLSKDLHMSKKSSKFARKFAFTAGKEFVREKNINQPIS
jgi:hypothetical protein